ncbi:MAG: leucyl/phenylalanyl-tRNA--protein transferase, partial [Deltaproteobacteria bacterium]
NVLQHAGFTLFDTQFVTSHLASLGGVEIARTAYKRQLQKAVKDPKPWEPLREAYSVAALLQRNSQIS